MGIQEFGGIGIRETHGQTAVKAGIQIMAGLTDRPGHAHPDLGIAAVGHDDVLFPVHEVIDLGASRKGWMGIWCFPIGPWPGLAVGFGLFQGRDPIFKPFLKSQGRFFFVDQAIADGQQRLDVTDHRQIHGAVPADLFRFNIRLEDLASLLKTSPKI